MPCNYRFLLDSRVFIFHLFFVLEVRLKNRLTAKQGRIHVSIIYKVRDISLTVLDFLYYVMLEIRGTIVGLKLCLVLC